MQLGNQEALKVSWAQVTIELQYADSRNTVLQLTLALSAGADRRRHVCGMHRHMQGASHATDAHLQQLAKDSAVLSVTLPFMYNQLSPSLPPRFPVLQGPGYVGDFAQLPEGELLCVAVDLACWPA